MTTTERIAKLQEAINMTYTINLSNTEERNSANNLIDEALKGTKITRPFLTAKSIVKAARALKA